MYWFLDAPEQKRKVRACFAHYPFSADRDQPMTEVSGWLAGDDRQRLPEKLQPKGFGEENFPLRIELDELAFREIQFSMVV